MARPNKEVLDYFQHDADSSKGKTLRIMFNHFGHDGISFWWQLLENISVNKNLVIVISNPEDVEDLASQVHFTPERMIAMLDKLATLDAIDKQLWQHRIIWCQNLVDRHKDVFNRWVKGAPERPIYLLSETELMSTETPKNHTIMPQNKRKENKVNNNGHFELFWTAYPKKKAKADAIKAFNKLSPDEPMLQSMLSSLELAKTSGDWLKEDGKYIPHPATWLNGRRWEDEITQPLRETTEWNMRG